MDCVAYKMSVAGHETRRSEGGECQISITRFMAVRPPSQTPSCGIKSVRVMQFADELLIRMVRGSPRSPTYYRGIIII